MKYYKKEKNNTITYFSSDIPPKRLDDLVEISLEEYTAELEKLFSEEVSE